MPTTQDCAKRIQQFQRPQLITLWQQIVAGNTPGWEKGKAFEFLVLRAFELEGAVVRWPYTVEVSGEPIEQIDGAIHFEDIAFSVIVECKDYAPNVNIEPITKLRDQLLRRSSNTIGSVFIPSKFTKTALILAQFLAPQTILLWEKDHIEFCLLNSAFKAGFIKKYRHSVEEGFPNFNVAF